MALSLTLGMVCNCAVDSLRKDRECSFFNITPRFPLHQQATVYSTSRETRISHLQNTFPYQTCPIASSEEVLSALRIGETSVLTGVLNSG